jgi:hypothetical protein
MARIVETGEMLAVEPALAYECDLILDSRFVLRRTNACGINEHTTRLQVVDEGVDERGAEQVRPDDD